MHRRTRLLSFTLTALAVMGVFSSVSMAVPSTEGGSPGAKPLLNPAKSKNVHFIVTYDAPEYYGPVKCKGKHQTSPKYPGNKTEGGREDEKCTSTTGLPLVELIPGAMEQTSFPKVGGGSAGLWESDYFLFAKGIPGVRTSDFKYTVFDSGKTFEIEAIYPFA
jgi:hypothetical protein